MAQDPKDRLLKLADVAKWLDVHIDTIREWVRQGEMPAIRLPGNAGYRVRTDDLESWLASRRTVPQKTTDE